jgi:hypothetical protein
MNEMMVNQRRLDLDFDLDRDLDRLLLEVDLEDLDRDFLFSGLGTLYFLLQASNSFR